MKIWYLSDLHIDFGKQHIKEYPEVDIVVILGDVGNRMSGWDFIHNLLNKGYQVLFILGNHEYYNNSLKRIYTMKEILKLWKDKELLFPNFHVLHNETFILDNVKFIGSTLWTNFSNQKQETIDLFYNEQNDSKVIFKTVRNMGFKRLGGTPINHHDVTSFYNESINFIKSEVDKPFNGHKIVLTHFAPSYQSIGEKYKQYVNDYGNYANLLDEYIQNSTIDYWIHGHIHTSSYYKIGNTTIACNPSGYKSERKINEEFDIIKIIEIK